MSLSTIRQKGMGYLRRQCLRRQNDRDAFLIMNGGLAGPLFSLRRMHVFLRTMQRCALGQTVIKITI